TGGGWPAWPIAWAVPRCARSPRSSHPTHCGDASATHCAEMDVCRTPGPSWGTRGDPTAGHPNGDGKSELGLHAHPGSPQEPGASSWPLNDRTHLESAWPVASARAAHFVANLPPCPLGRHCRGGFLHDRGLDVARSRDVLHRVHDRSGITPPATCRIDAASG